MLFTFPSRYWFTIGLYGVFSLAGWSRLIHTEFLVLRTTQDTTRILQPCLYGAVTLSRRPFQNVPVRLQSPHRGPITPPMPKHRRFGLFRVRSPLLAESLLFSLPTGTKMFQFPAFAHRLAVCQAFSLAGSPIRKSKDQRPFAPPLGLSQLITSFFAS